MLFRRIKSGASSGKVGGWGAECFLLREEVVRGSLLWVPLAVGGGGAGLSLFEDLLRTDGVAEAGTWMEGEENLA